MSGYTELTGLVTFRPLQRPVQCAARNSAFRARWTDTVELLARELRFLGASQVVLEYDFREKDLRIDGLPRAGATANTPGIVLSFIARGIPGHPPLRYEVGTYRHWQDNLRAVALSLAALRAVNRYGVTRRGEQYAGWRQLNSGPRQADAATGAAIVAEYGSMAAALRATHPDHGGARQAYEDVLAFKEASA